MSCDLYYGQAGILIFLLEAFHLTGDPDHLEAAKASAEFLRRHLDAVRKFGLFDGLAGIGFALAQLDRATRDYSEAANEIADRLKTGVRENHYGIKWNRSFDVVSGTAGIGLGLLDLARTIRRSDLLELAIRAGDQLMNAMVKTPDGCGWPPTRRDSSEYPNFAHGTAGIAYFLAKLFGSTKQPKYLQAATSAAHYLQTIMCREGKYNGLIAHDTKEGRDLFYLSWCHGPAGTSRLFFQLFRETRDERWLQPVIQSAATILASGAPERNSPGYWNNVGLCCGAAGIAEWMLALSGRTAGEAYRNFAQRIAHYLLERASPDDHGLRWTQAENRRRPEAVKAQIGLMQGAAGIGLFFIHMEETCRSVDRLIRFPDSPW